MRPPQHGIFLVSLDQQVVGQNQWYHFGVGAPPTLVYLSGWIGMLTGYDLAFDPWPYMF